MAGRGSPATTLRSYAYDLQRWFRFLWAIDVAWDRAERVDARDFLLWVSNAPKPPRPRRGGRRGPAPGSVNRITGKASPPPPPAAGYRPEVLEALLGGPFG
jgi:hypothetical protein